MAQKIFAGRTPGAGDAAEAEVRVDQVVLVRSPGRAYAEALSLGFKRSLAEVAIVYEGQCVTTRDGPEHGANVRAADFLARGVLVARPGAGFPCAVHIERLASPARLCVTDDPRLAGVGGLGMLAMVVPPTLLGRALARGTLRLRTPVTVQISLGGRLRPFVCARDVALELLRRGTADVVRDVEASRRARVVLEFVGPSVRGLSVSERAVIAAAAPQVGAAASLFASDERTEVFLRDQRRSKAHRSLSPDAGAPCEEVVHLDLGAVDPLALDEDGRVRTVRELVGTPVKQALLGGDTGTTLRDLFAAATLLKSKRVSSKLEFLLAVPSRQMLEVLSRAGALSDLLATGARLVEPDFRIVSSEMYPPPPDGMSVRTCDPEPSVTPSRCGMVVSSETLAFVVATGQIGDPRSFKRPVKVALPRTLPTEDVFIARKEGRSNVVQASAAPERHRARAEARSGLSLSVRDAVR